MGCDALRFSLVTGCTSGQDINLSLEKIESNRNFVNKIWNIGKYLQNNIDTLSEKEKESLVFPEPISMSELSSFSLAERYIVSKLHSVIAEATYMLENYDFGGAGRVIYEFIWDEFADWFVEV